MRSKVLRHATVGLLAAVLTVPLGVRPARAAIDWGEVIKAAIAVVGSWTSASNTEAAIREATTKILAAVDSAKSQILNQMETIAVAEARSCATHAVIEFADIERMTPDNMQQFAQAATGCAVSIESLMSALTDKGRTDQLGFAVNVVTPIALVARARTGLTTSSLENTLRQANNLIVSRLDASCDISSWEANPDLPPPPDNQLVLWTIACYAYNGNPGYHYVYAPYVGPIPDSAIQVAVNNANSNTSRAIAVAVLPTL
jgi:hypothetical protein